MRYCGFPNFTDFLTRQACLPEEQVGGCFIWALAELGGSGLERCGLAALLETGIRAHFCAITSRTGTGLCIDATDTPPTAQACSQPKPCCYRNTLTRFILAAPASRGTLMLGWAAPAVTYVTGTPVAPGKSRVLQWRPTDNSASQNQKGSKHSNFIQNPPSIHCVCDAGAPQISNGWQRNTRRLSAARWMSYRWGMGDAHNSKVCPRIAWRRLIF